MRNLTNNLFKVLFIFALAFSSFNSYAENSKEFGDYVIHYNAFRSDTISPEVAKQYNLARANNRVIINIAVLKKVMNTTGTPTSSEVTGHASNLTGQLKQLEFKEITEGNAIYYLAETKISDGEFLKFDVKILPQGEKKPARLKFNKRFFTY
ncbi:MAG: DUF4426 domain-containing protein [Gammaproteobacteria bacterium]|nr:DUF4426 domain-containing protein [Gammaproteobacteria bacterium]